MLPSHMAYPVSLSPMLPPSCLLISLPYLLWFPDDNSRFVYVAVFPAICVATVLSPLDAEICTLPSLRVYVSEIFCTIFSLTGLILLGVRGL